MFRQAQHDRGCHPERSRRIDNSNKKMKEYYVYILQCKDGSYYTGVTNDIDRRLWEHQEGINNECYTYRRRPVKLVYVENFNDVNQAIAFEKQIKGWSRKKKEALIHGNWEEIKKLAECKNESHYKNYHRNLNEGR